jgi:hypothetical protein
MPKKTPQAAKPEDSDDHEVLQAMDEANEEWVKEWKKAAKVKPEK